jgi:spore germination protein GerM
LKLKPNSENGDVNISLLKILINGTLLAIVMAVPAIITTVVFHYVIKSNLIITISAGVITLFVAMGFAYKISKRLSV